MSLSAKAEDSLTVYAPDFDFIGECQSLTSKLPRKVSSIRRMRTLLREKTVKTDEYGCHGSPKACSLHHMEFEGITLDLVATEDSDPYVVTATISSNKNRLLDKIFVGQSIEEFEKAIKNPLPKGKVPIDIDGDCLGLSAWHDGKHITKIRIECDCT